MVDNFNELKKYLDFSDYDRFYYLQLLVRKKENPNQDKSVKVIREYYIDDMDYYDKIESQVKELCHSFNARAYLRLNRRSWKKVSFHMLKRLTTLIEQEDYKASRSLLSKAMGLTFDEDKEDKVWIIDIDDVNTNHILDRNYVDNIKQVINELHSEVTDKNYQILGEINTKNGVHLLSNPFNRKIFSEHFQDIDIHTDNPTILYAI